MNKELLKNAFEAGRTWQNAEIAEYNGGRENEKPNFEEWYEREVKKLNMPDVNGSALPPLHEMAAANFDSIAELAAKLWTGNVSHQGRTILGLARRNAEFIRKHYR